MRSVCELADSLDLQIAVHAIGDKAVDDALDCLQFAINANGPKLHRRHRIEHLELTRPESVPRLAQLGVTASIQPVHASPAVQENWRAMLGGEGNHRCGRAFAWADFLAHGALLALGTDVPTTPHTPLQNLYVAQTRRAPTLKDRHLPPTTPRWAISLLDALNAATTNSAVACKSEELVGTIEVGKCADLVALDVDIVAQDGGESLVTARVIHTWIVGQLAFSAS